MKSYYDHTRIMDGNVFLFIPKRKDPDAEKVWQCRITLPGIPAKDFIIRKSLRTTDKRDAIERAKKLYYEAQSRRLNEEPLRPTTWKELASTYIDERRPGKKFKYDLKTYLNPFFDKIEDVSKMDTALMTRFWNWRLNRWKDWTKPTGQFASSMEPAHAAPIPRITTLIGLRASLRAVVSFAHDNGYLKKMPNADIPPDVEAVCNAARPGTVRGRFKDNDYRKLRRNLTTRALQLERGIGIKGNTKQQRLGLERMRFAVLLISNTALRPSTMLKLRHLHITREPGNRAWEKEEGRAYTKISVPKEISKRKDQDRVILSHDYDATYGYYQRFKSIQEEYGHPTRPQDLIFGSTRRPDKPANLAAYFRKLLEDWDLLEDWSTGIARNRVLYSLRSYAITKALERGVGIHVVAHNSLTSVRMIEKHYSDAISWNMRDFLHKDRTITGKTRNFAVMTRREENELENDAIKQVEEES